MSDITVTAANVGLANKNGHVIRSLMGGATFTGGQAVYVDSGGLGQLTAGGATATSNFAGIALPIRNSSGNAGAAGQVMEIVEQGDVEGFNLSGLAYWAPVYISNTSGALATSAGTHGPGPVGVVVPTTDKDGSGNYRKLLRIAALSLPQST